MLPHITPDRATIATKGKRSVAIDLVRLLGLVVVVAGHVWSEYPIGGYVAIFFVLSGYLWSEKRTIKEDLEHRTRILLVPYASWLVIVGGVFLITRSLAGDSPRELASLFARMLWGGEKIYTPLTAFWFLTAIFAAVVVYRQLRRFRPPLFIAALVTCAAATLIGPVLSNAPLALGTGVACIGFVAAGHGFRKIEPRLPAPVALASITLIAAGVLVGSGLVQRMDLKYGYFGTPLVSVLLASLIGCSALVLAKRLAPKLPRRVGEGVSSMVQMSTPIILLHTIPLWLFADVLPKPVLFILGFALAISVGRLLLFAPASRMRSLLMPGK